MAFIKILKNNKMKIKTTISLNPNDGVCVGCKNLKNPYKGICKNCEVTVSNYKTKKVAK
jgi:hypothetical protein